jgi:hypothetical protein
MMELKSQWVVRGYFDVAEYPIMPAIKDRLAVALGRPMHIAVYPPGPKFKRTYWWREGDDDYVEAQFCMRIDGDYPVLSIGVSVEKGLEQAAAAGKAFALMDRKTWDWRRLLDGSAEIFAKDVPRLASVLTKPLSIRILARRWDNGKREEALNRTFVCTEDRFFERHVGGVPADTIVSHLRELDQKQDFWVNVQFACDLLPADVEGLTEDVAAALLLKFNPLRKRMRAT